MTSDLKIWICYLFGSLRLLAVASHRHWYLNFCSQKHITLDNKTYFLITKSKTNLIAKSIVKKIKNTHG